MKQASGKQDRLLKTAGAGILGALMLAWNIRMTVAMFQLGGRSAPDLKAALRTPAGAR